MVTTNHVKDLTSFLLIIIPIAAAARIVYCLTVMSIDGDEEKSYKVRIRNVLIFIVLAETIVGVLNWTSSYFMQ